MQGTSNSQNNLEKEDQRSSFEKENQRSKLEDSYLQFLKPTTNLQYSRQCGTGIRIHIQVNEIELRVYGYLHARESSQTPNSTPCTKIKVYQRSKCNS